MFGKYVEGYTSDANNCPFCGCEIDTYCADGSQTCTECGRKFFVIEDDTDD